jgi:acetylornithine deacetylase/succinyl-diaminopimelate desuccinylase-like protein
MSSQPVLNAIAASLRAIEPGEAVELARALVRIPSVTGHEGREISDAVADWLRSHDIPVVLQEVAPGRVNVCARIDGREPGPRLMINGHLDTKPFEGMTIDPTGAEVRDGRLWGRGACDMKSAVAAAMVAARAINQTGGLRRGSLLIGCEVGEEGGGWTLADLIDGPGACDALICAEPTNLDVHVGCRGSFRPIVRTLGLATHTGTAYQGVNAIEKMTRVIQALYTLPQFHALDPVWDRAPINAESIRGGGQISSSVPDECEVRFDIRLNPGLTPETLQLAFDETFARLQADDPQLRVEWSLRQPGALAQQIDRDDPLLGSMVAAVRSVRQAEPRLAGFPGGCSAGILLARGIPAVVFGPGNLSQAHSADEWIDVEQIDVAARVYATAALGYLG